MNLLLKRMQFSDNSTIGELHIDGKFICFTLEDAVREFKIAGETAIPYGEYSVVYSFSEKFKRMLPLLLNVPNFTGIRIHAGNTDEDTRGCILVGMGYGQDSIFDSRKALALVTACFEQFPTNTIHKIKIIDGRHEEETKKEDV